MTRCYACSQENCGRNPCSCSCHGMASEVAHETCGHGIPADACPPCLRTTIAALTSEVARLTAERDYLAKWQAWACRLHQELLCACDDWAAACDVVGPPPWPDGK